LKCFK